MPLRVRCQLIGSGVQGDEFRVNLPVYQMVGDPDYVGKTVVVDVPDAYHPFTPAQIATVPKTAAGALGQVVTTMPAPLMLLWNQFHDKTWRELAGTFRPVVQ